MFESGPKAKGVLTVIVRLSGDDVRSFDICFESYPDIWGEKEVWTNVSNVDEACDQFRNWLEACLAHYERGHDQVTQQ